jgi:hypothetical protein
MTGKIWRTAVLAAIAALASAIVACGGGDNVGATTGPSGTQQATGSGAAISGVVLTQADAETFMRALADDYNASNADGFLGKFTDQGLAAFLGDSVTPPTDLRDQARNFIGSGAQINVQGVDGFTSAGGKTTFYLTSIQGNTVEREQFVLVQQNGQTLVDGYTKVAPNVPSGVVSVSVGATEARYDFDASKVTSGNIAFVLTDNGTQRHEMVLTKVDNGPSLTDLEQSAAAASNSSDLPAGFEELIGSVSAAPSQSATMVLAQPLGSGRYAFFDFTPDANDPNGRTFSDEGMAAEFTVP